MRERFILPSPPNSLLARQFPFIFQGNLGFILFTTIGTMVALILFAQLDG